MLILIACFALTLWFYRQDRQDVWFWSFLFWLGLVATGWRNYTFVADYDWSILLPLIIRDLLTVGLVGLVQSMAVRKQIPLWQAVIFMFALFAASRMIEVGAGPYNGDAISQESSLPAEQLLESDAYAEEFEYLVDLSLTETDDSDFRRWAAQHGYRVERAFSPADPDVTELDDYYLLDAPAYDQATTDLLENSGLFDEVEGNDLFVLELPDISPLSSPEGGSRGGDPLIGQQWAYPTLDFPAYYQLLSTLPAPPQKTRLFILDTGVDAQHEDLRDHYRSHRSKYDRDPHGHGTHCAGIAAAATHNGLGIASLNAGGLVEISGIQVLGRSGIGTQKTIISGILEAADAGADVISLSLGGRARGDKRRSYNRAINYANRKGAIVIVAAGNSGRAATNYVPASAAGAITVAAVDPQLQRARFSNSLQGIKQPICAPGVGIHSTVPGGYRSYSGTSMACPLVAGLVAVMRAYDPSLDTEGVYRILAETGQRGSGWNETGPLLQPAAALARVVRD